MASRKLPGDRSTLVLMIEELQRYATHHRGLLDDIKLARAFERSDAAGRLALLSGEPELFRRSVRIATLLHTPPPLTLSMRHLDRDDATILALAAVLKTPDLGFDERLEATASFVAAVLAPAEALLAEVLAAIEGLDRGPWVEVPQTTVVDFYRARNWPVGRVAGFLPRLCGSGEIEGGPATDAQGRPRRYCWRLRFVDPARHRDFIAFVRDPGGGSGTGVVREE